MAKFEISLTEWEDVNVEKEVESEEVFEAVRILTNRVSYPIGVDDKVEVGYDWDENHMTVTITYVGHEGSTFWARFRIVKHTHVWNDGEDVEETIGFLFVSGGNEIDDPEARDALDATGWLYELCGDAASGIADVEMTK